MLCSTAPCWLNDQDERTGSKQLQMICKTWRIMHVLSCYKHSSGNHTRCVCDCLSGDKEKKPGVLRFLHFNFNTVEVNGVIQQIRQCWILFILTWLSFPESLFCSHPSSSLLSSVISLRLSSLSQLQLSSPCHGKFLSHCLTNRKLTRTANVQCTSSHWNVCACKEQAMTVVFRFV